MFGSGNTHFPAGFYWDSKGGFCVPMVKAGCIGSQWSMEGDFLGRQQVSGLSEVYKEPTIVVLKVAKQEHIWVRSRPPPLPRFVVP